MLVNLDVLVKPPFQGAHPERKGCSLGWVKLHKHGGKLFINDREMGWFLSSAQEGGKSVEGNLIVDSIRHHDVIHPNVLDAVLARQEFAPRFWKEPVNGRPKFICFWGVLFTGRLGNRCVRYVYWDGYALRPFHRWLDAPFGEQELAAIRLA